MAIDDFGAGYTSFRNLQMLHVDTVKIDGSYVKDLTASPENQVFVRTLMGLAKNFDMKDVAEWVGSEPGCRAAAKASAWIISRASISASLNSSPAGTKS